MLWGILRSNKGFTVLTVTLISSAIVLGGMSVSYYVQNRAAQASQNVTKNKIEYLHKKSIVIGNYLVSNNLILCKEDGWGSPQKCKWGGDLQDPEVKTSTFYLLDRATEKNTLRYKVSLPELPYGYEQELLFDLKQFSNSDGIKTFGDIPDEIQSVDADYFFVSIKSRITNKQLGFSAEREYGIRRPIAKLVISTQTKGSCNLSCVSSMGQNPNPSCRGPQESPSESISELNIKATNQGPGAIYEIYLNRNKTFNDAYYTKDDESEIIDLMKDVEVIMPGEEVTLADPLECLAPKRVTRTTVTRRRGGNGGRQTVVTTSVHGEVFSTVNYLFSLDLYRRYLSTKDPALKTYYEPARIFTKSDENVLTYKNSRDVVTTNVQQIYTYSH